MSVRNLRSALAALVALAVFAPPAAANHIAGATYNGTHAQGGTVSFTVTPDGSGISSFSAGGPVQGSICSFPTGSATMYAQPLPIVNHAFNDTSTTFAKTGAFPGPQSASGTFRIRAPVGPGMTCDSGDVSWNATTTAAPPPADTDGDGVPDPSDACPTQPAQTPNGCPSTAPPSGDTDGDGVPNSLDACPTQPAQTANGCPAQTPGAPSPTDGDDVLNGTAAEDVICGLLGNDTIRGLGGNDTIFGDLCNQRSRVAAAQATGGNDTLKGDAGNDKLYGAAGNDKLDGGAGNDRLYGGAGKDKLTGSTGNDTLDGGAGDDTLSGGTGTNKYKAGAGNDTVSAKNRRKETVDCGTGRRDKVRADRTDKLRGCERVSR